MANQFNCRYLENPNLPKPLHVHEDPGYTEDALRNQQVGWCVHLNRCLHPEVPWESGDRRQSPSTLLMLAGAR